MSLSEEYKKISVIGLGYIGLPTAAVLASRKIMVVGVDVNQQAVDTINKGEIHIVEPDLDIVVRSTVNEGYLRASTTPEQADAFLITVPTPFKGTNHEPDLTFIESAARAIAPVLKRGNLVILESTSPVGATEKLETWLAECRSDLSFPSIAGDQSDIRIAHCPERVLPGRVLRELVENDRVIGGVTERCSEAAAALYKIFVTGECLITSARTAEMAKLTENAFRDVNIAFANELSMICAELEIDVWELIRLANRHPRVNILQPGPGVGGHCIAVDPWFIVSNTPSQARLIRSAREVNESKPDWVIRKIRSAINTIQDRNPEKSLKEISIAFYGLAFKPDIDDLRESPALKIACEVTTTHSGKVFLVEPNITALGPSLIDQELVSFEKASKTADIHVLLVDHKSFIGSKPKAGIIVDTKGIWS